MQMCQPWRYAQESDAVFSISKDRNCQMLKEFTLVLKDLYCLHVKTYQIKPGALWIQKEFFERSRNFVYV